MTQKGEDDQAWLNLGLLLLRGFDWFDRALLARMESAGGPPLKKPHSLVFAYLDAEGTRPAELARRIGVSRQAVHQTLRELQALGLVALGPDPTDARARLVVLTEEGRAAVARALAAFEEIEDELCARIGSRRAGAMREALEADWGEPRSDR